jgi:alpha-L-rhamnosidase
MRILLLLSLLIVIALPFASMAAGLTAGELRCDYLETPIGLDDPQPRLSWKLAGDQRGQMQSAWQVLVASTMDGLNTGVADLWDSGKIASTDSIQIAYQGKPLASGQECFWKVRVFDQDGLRSPWSEPARWTVGLLDPDDIHAKWIAAEGAADVEPAILGYHSAESRRADDVKWVQVDLGLSLPIDAVRLHAMYHAGTPGFGFPVRFTVKASDDADCKDAVVIADETASDYPNPGHSAVRFDAKHVAGRFVRVTATRLAHRADGPKPFGLALAELEVFSGGKNVALHAAVSAKDSVESYGWGKSLLTDGRGLAPDAPGHGSRAPFTSLPIFRRSFTIAKPVQRATAYICGLGQHEVELNGRKVGGDLLEPGWTDYRKTCLYVTYDIGSHLKQGENVIGVMLGNGMYNVAGPRYTKFTGSFGRPKLIGQIDIEYADGTSDRLVTDDSWKCAAGPITFSSIYGGEDYNALLEQTGWDAPGFNDSDWQPAIEVDGPGGTLAGASHSAPAIRVMQVFEGKLLKQPKPGVWVYDLGQNCAILPRITVRGSGGQTVKIIPGELLDKDGAVSQATSGGPAWFAYTLRGEGSDETWSPRFTYYGCRFLQIEGLQPEKVEGLFISSTSPAVGEFSCSNELFNRTNTLIRWAMRSNMMSVLTDCPHRERLGWLEQDHLVGPSLMYDFSIPTMYGKVCRDMTDSQLDNGLVPDIAPEYAVFSGGFRDSPEWGSACVLLPWQLYQWYDDTTVLAEQYPTMRRYVAYLGTQANDHIVSEGLGDWYDLGPQKLGPAQLTPTSLTATAFYYRDLTILEQAARILGKTDDVEECARLAGEVRDAFNKSLYRADAHSYSTGSQTANAIPLVMGLAPEQDRAAILQNLVDGIRKNDNRLTAGDVGYRYLLKALADGGRSDVICDMNSRSERPGYGYIINTGATALTEGWDGSASQDHFMLGHIMEWFYSDLAGIRCDPDAIAFQKIIIRPTPVGGITWAKASYDSIRGKIISSWKKEGDQFFLDVTIPPGTTATVYIPTADADFVREGGASIRNSKEIKFVREENGDAIYAIESGNYHFESRTAGH